MYLNMLYVTYLYVRIEWLLWKSYMHSTDTIANICRLMMGTYVEQPDGKQQKLFQKQWLIWTNVG